MQNSNASKTPKFDKLLDEIFADLVPHKRVCKWKGEHQHCEGEFEITEEDISFLKMLRVPPPNFCPICRRIKRFVFMGINYLFKIKCAVPGHNEQMISIFSEDCPFPVYDYKYFISDEFDPFSFGRDYKDGDSPLETLWQMRKVFPMPSFLNRDPSSINSEYSNGGRNSKNAYYAFAAFDCEDVWYTVITRKCRDVMDSRLSDSSEHAYSLTHSDNIYKSSFVYFSKDCTDSMFLFDCRNCDNCFGCVNLRNKKYCVWNKQLSKEEYEEFIKKIYPLTRNDVRAYTEQLWQLVKELPPNASRNTSSQNVSGVTSSNTRNAYDVTEMENSEHVRYADGGLSHKDSMDLVFSGGHSSLIYMSTNVGSQSSNVKFSVSYKYSTNSEFVFNSKNIDNCFMCFGLQDKSYCVLNKQYSKEDYFSLVDKIKCEMVQRGEYEDGVSMQFSPQSYNYSLVSLSFPLADAEILKIGSYVASEPESNAGEVKILSAKEVPQTIDETTDEILKHGIVCEVTGRPFRIVATELDFYRRMKLPLPTVSPVARMNEKAALLKIGIQHRATCAKCNIEFRSAFNPKDGFILYCERCFQQEVY